MTILMENASGRKLWIDIARACGIFVIVYSHLVVSESVISQFFCAFRVPIFFTVMGLTFSYRKGFAQFAQKKAMRIMVPYFCFALLSILIAELIDRFYPSLSEGRVADLWHNLWGAVYGNGRTGNMKWYLPLWFLPCSYLTLLAVYGFEGLIDGAGSKKTLLRILFILLSIVLTVVYRRFFRRFMLPFGAEVAIPMSGFVEMGILLKGIDENIKPSIGGLLGTLLIALAFILSLHNGRVNTFVLGFGTNMAVFYFVAIAAIVGVLLLSIWFCSFDLFERARKAICYCGRHTIIILCLHKYPILVFQLVIPYTKKLFRYSGDSVMKNLAGFIVSVFVIILCLIAEIPIRRICPVALGDMRNRRKHNINN